MPRRTPTPSAYGARLTDVQRLRRDDSLVQHRITWETDLDNGGKYRWTANTQPGGDVNRTLELMVGLGPLPETPLVIITNGRGTVIFVEHYAEAEAEEPSR